jgi:hypothetical protein
MQSTGLHFASESTAASFPRSTKSDEAHTLKFPRHMIFARDTPSGYGNGAY